MESSFSVVHVYGTHYGIVLRSCAHTRTSGTLTEMAHLVLNGHRHAKWSPHARAPKALPVVEYAQMFRCH